MSFIKYYDIADVIDIFDLLSVSDSLTAYVKHFQPATVLTK